MKTVEILQSLIHSIEVNPTSLYQIPWENVKQCLAMELDCRKELYPATQLETIHKLFDSRFLGIEKHLALPDVSAIVSLLKELVFALQLLPDTDYADSLTQRIHFSETCLNHYVNNTIIVLGDSHVNFFSGNEFLTFLPIGNDINVCPNITANPFTALHLGPCLACHCNKPDTSTRFREKVDYLCNNFIKPNACIICCLGEIDLRVHVFRQVKLQQRSYQDIVDDILSEYLSFLISLKEKGYQVFCWGPIASQREVSPIDPAFPRNGTETERNMATAYFNAQLAAKCRQHNIGFLSIFDQMITEDFQTIETYLSADHCHLSQRALTLAQPLWKSMLYQFSR